MKKPDMNIYRNDNDFERARFQDIRRRGCSEFCRESGRMYMSLPDPDDKQPKEKKPKYKYKEWQPWMQKTENRKNGTENQP